MGRRRILSSRHRRQFSGKVCAKPTGRWRLVIGTTGARRAVPPERNWCIMHRSTGVLMKRIRGVLVIAAVSGVVVGCGERPAPEGPQPVVRGAAAPSTVLPVAVPETDWDRPFKDGLQTTTSDARTAGQLSFAPQLPHFVQSPVRIQVTDPAATPQDQRAVAFVYRFPTGVNYPTDGRVVVTQTATDQTVANLDTTVEDPPGPPENFRMIDVAGQRALLITGDGVGRVRFIRSGVMFDITGPAVSPTVVSKLAELL